MVYPLESWSCFCASATTLANYHSPATHFPRLLPWIMLNFGHIFLHFLNAVLCVGDIMLGEVPPLPCCQCLQDAAEAGEQIRGLGVQPCQIPGPGCDLAPLGCRVTRQFFPAIVLLLFMAVIHPIHWHKGGFSSSLVYNGFFCQGSDI